MVSMIPLIFLLPLLHPVVQCLEVLNTDYLDPWNEAKVDFDLGVKPHLGQKDFPEIWQRELMAHTALSRLEAAQILSLEAGNGNQTWLRFRSSGLYEALLNMVRISDFQMFNRSFPNAWSMWGLQASVLAYKNEKRRGKEDRYGNHRYAATGYPFDPSRSSLMAQTSMAYLMAVKWAVDLQNKVHFLANPSYTLSQAVEAYILLRDPTSYWLGTQDEGLDLLRAKYVNTRPPQCSREAHVAIAFDSYGFDIKRMNLVNYFFRDLIDTLPNAKLTIRGASHLPGGFVEGGLLNKFPSLRESSKVRRFDILDLVGSSIEDLKLDLKAGNILKARVILCIAEFKDREPDIPRAKLLWDVMQSLDIEPLFVGIETGFDDADLMPLLNEENFRGVVSWSYTVEGMRVVMHRVLRLICRSVNSIPSDSYKYFKTFSNTTYSIYDRVHLQIPPRKQHKRGNFDVSFKCASPVCRFHVYGHLQRHVNEYFHDTHAEIILEDQQMQTADFFSDSWNFIESGPLLGNKFGENMTHTGIHPATNLVVVPAIECLVGAKVLPSTA